MGFRYKKCSSLQQQTSTTVTYFSATAFDFNVFCTNQDCGSDYNRYKLLAFSGTSNTFLLSSCGWTWKRLKIHFTFCSKLQHVGNTGKHNVPAPIIFHYTSSSSSRFLKLDQRGALFMCDTWARSGLKTRFGPAPAPCAGPLKPGMFRIMSVGAEWVQWDAQMDVERGLAPLWCRWMAVNK